MITAPEIKYRPGAYLIHFCQPLGDPTRPRACARRFLRRLTHIIPSFRPDQIWYDPQE